MSKDDSKPTTAEDERKRRMAAFRDRKPAGPEDSDVQVRQAGTQCTRTHAGNWDSVDESSDESFPASDPPAKY